MKALLSTICRDFLPGLLLGACLPPMLPSPMKKLYRFNTNQGPFYIAEFKKRFYLLYKDEESLGSYATPEEAAEGVDVVSFLALKGLDVSSLKIPKDLNEWERLR